MYGEPIRRTAADEGPAYGAALLAGVVARTYGDVGEEAYEEYYRVYRSLYPATREAMSRPGELASGGEGGSG